MGRSSRGGRGRGRSSRSAGRSGSRSGSSGSRSSSSSSRTTSVSRPSPSVSSFSVQKAYASPASPTGSTFSTASGPVRVSQSGNQISPQSPAGKTIQKIYDRQKVQRPINKEQKKLFDRVTGAKAAKEAFNIQQRSETFNPNVGTFQQAYKGGKLMETKGRLGVGTGDVTITNKRGTPAEYFKTQDFFGSDGQRVATIDTRSDSANLSQTSAKSNKINQQSAIGDFFSVGEYVDKKTEKAKEIVNDQYLKDDEKAFDFFPDVPKGDDPYSKAAAGVIKGTSNTLASFFNLGATVEDTARYATGGKPLKSDAYVGYYSTPVTNVETGFFDAAVGTVKGAVKGEKFDAGKPIQKGGTDAIDNFFSKPVESTFSTAVEILPYAIGGVVRGGSKAVKGGLDFFKPGPTTKSYQAQSPKGTGNFAQDFFYSKPDKGDVFKLDTASPGFMSTKTPLGRGTTQFFGKESKSVKDYWSGKSTPTTKKTTTKPDDFFKETKTSGGMVVLQMAKQAAKQKTKTKQLNGKAQKSLVDDFFKQKQKTKTKQITVQKQKQKQKSMTDQFFSQKSKQSFITPLKTKGKTKQGAGIKASSKSKQRQDFFAPTKSSGMGKAKGAALFTAFFMQGGKRGSKTKRNPRGSKSYTAWNVNPDVVGGFFKGPQYRTSKSSSVIRQANKRVAQASKKRKKQGGVKDIYSNFL